MLELNSPRWNELTHAYGQASDIPALLEQLKAAPPPADGQSEPWFSLWSALCHQSDVYTASYAAIPHIVALAASKPRDERLEHISFTGAVEAFRHRKKAPEIPGDLKESYFSSLEQAVSLILECLELEWEEPGYRVLLGAFATVRGQPGLGNAITNLPDEAICPKCESYVPPNGYDLNEI